MDLEEGDKIVRHLYTFVSPVIPCTETSNVHNQYLVCVRVHLFVVQDCGYIPHFFVYVFVW